MIFCTMCGKEYSNNALLCPNCGEPNILLKNKINSPSNAVATLLLCFFLGAFGAHRFYVGKVGTGLVMFLLTITVAGFVITGIWSFIDLILIICQSFRDKDGKLIKFS